MKMTVVLLLLIEPVILRSACDMRRALQADVRVAHFAFDFGARHERGDESMTTMSTAAERTSVSAISSASSPVSGCATMQVGDVHAELLRVAGVERVLGVDEDRVAAVALGVRDDRERERRLAEDSGP